MASKPTKVSLAKQLFQTPLVEITPIQEIAIDLYLLGLNVFPVPYGKKGGWVWRRLQYTRLNPEDLLPLFRGQCNLAVMTGRTSQNLFIIDCETKTSFKSTEHHLKQAGVPIWAVQTGSNAGGGHFYLRCSAGEIKGQRFNDYEVRGNRCYVLAPPSLHPDGRLYQWYKRESPEPPVVSLEQLTWLPLKPAQNSPKAMYANSLSALSQNTRDFLFSGASEGERNNRLFNAACDLAGNNYGYDAAMNMLFRVALQCGLVEREIYDTIKSAYSQPRTPAKKPNSQQAIPHYELAKMWAADFPWKGKCGQTDRAVFLACCERAVTANEKGIFRASSREIANIARITRTTASISLRRLIDQKVLIYCGQDRQIGANLYRLARKTTAITEKNSRIRDTLLKPVLVVDSVTVSGKNSLSVASHDAAEVKALGKTAFYLYQVMVRFSSSVRAKALAEASKLTVKQVYRGLDRLRQFGLVERVSGGFRAVVQSLESLDEVVARPVGTLGKGEQRKLRHQRERASLAAAELYKARFGVGGKPAILLSVVRKFLCPNCGQVWSLGDLEPPDWCDYCGDLTTWKELSDT